MRVNDLSEMDKMLRPIPEDGAVHLDLLRDTARWVVLEINCAVKTAFRLETFDRKTGDSIGDQFLTNCEGRERLRFKADGPVCVWAAPVERPEAFEVWWFTAEFENPTIVVEDQVIFTKIAERKARNPELELMMRRSEENMLRRLGRMHSEYEARYGAMHKQLASALAAGTAPADVVEIIPDATAEDAPEPSPAPEPAPVKPTKKEKEPAK